MGDRKKVPKVGLGELCPCILEGEVMVSVQTDLHANSNGIHQVFSEIWRWS